jgi:hypothetical protein
LLRRSPVPALVSISPSMTIRRILLRSLLVEPCLRPWSTFLPGMPRFMPPSVSSSLQSLRRTLLFSPRGPPPPSWHRLKRWKWLRSLVSLKPVFVASLPGGAISSFMASLLRRTFLFQFRVGAAVRVRARARGKVKHALRLLPRLVPGSLGPMLRAITRKR